MVCGRCLSTFVVVMALGLGQAVFAAQATIKVVESDESKEAQGSRDAQVFQKEVQALLKLIKKWHMKIEPKQDKRPEAARLFAAYVCNRVYNLDKQKLLQLLISKTQQDQAVYTEALRQCSYKPMNEAQCEKEWLVAREDFFMSVNAYYFEHTQVAAWCELAGLAFGEPLGKVLGEKSDSLFERCVVSVFNEKHAKNEAIDAAFAIAAYTSFTDSLVAYLRNAVLPSVKQAKS